MICGRFSESAEKFVRVEDVDGEVFSQVLDLWCGKEDGLDKGLDEVKQLAIVADRLQMTEVIDALEITMIEHLNVGNCIEMLTWSRWIGLKRLETAVRKVAVERFDDVVMSATFAEIEEETFESLLEDSGLATKNEEAVWDALVRWMKNGAGQLRGRGLLTKIRFPLMSKEFLSWGAVQLLPHEHADWAEGLVAEALQAKVAHSDGSPFILRLLGAQAQVPRAGVGVRWREYIEGGERRLVGHTSNVCALTECGESMCSGAQDGSICVWSRATLGLERTLHAGDPRGGWEDGVRAAMDPVNALVAWRGSAISAHDSGTLRAWDVRTGACETIHGHARVATALAVCGLRLLSGSWDRSVKVWAGGLAAGAAPSSTWAVCERTLRGHRDWVWSLAAWQGKAVSGSGDEIRVWDAGTGGLDAVLESHGGTVRGLVVRGDVLFAGTADGAIRAWAAGGWTALRAVAACGVAPRCRGPAVRCLAVSGSRLVSGSDGGVRVWDLESLEEEHALRPPAPHAALTLAAVGGEVWAGVGTSVVVWGR